LGLGQLEMVDIISGAAHLDRVGRLSIASTARRYCGRERFLQPRNELRRRNADDTRRRAADERDVPGGVAAIDEIRTEVVEEALVFLLLLVELALRAVALRTLPLKLE